MDRYGDENVPWVIPWVTNREKRRENRCQDSRGQNEDCLTRKRELVATWTPPKWSKSLRRALGGKGSKVCSKMATRVNFTTATLGRNHSKTAFFTFRVVTKVSRFVMGIMRCKPGEMHCGHGVKITTAIR